MREKRVKIVNSASIAEEEERVVRDESEPGGLADKNSEGLNDAAQQVKASEENRGQKCEGSEYAPRNRETNK